MKHLTQVQKNAQHLLLRQLLQWYTLTLNLTPTLTLTLILIIILTLPRTINPITTLTLTLCCQRYCRRSKCQIIIQKGYHKTRHVVNDVTDEFTNNFPDSRTEYMIWFLVFLVCLNGGIESWSGIFRTSSIISFTPARTLHAEVKGQ